MSEVLDEKSELWFTALGPSGAGKTTMLACMWQEFSHELGGFFNPSDLDTTSTLRDAYEEIKTAANDKSKPRFSRNIGGTANVRQYPFILKGRKGGLPVRFFDFPGGWMMSDRDEADKDNYDKVVRIVNKSRVIFVAINTPYLMKSPKNETEEKLFKRMAGVNEVGKILTEIQRETNKLIVFVPIKCEAYTQNDDDREKLRNKVNEVFIDYVLKVDNNPTHKGRLAIAYMPIHTVGNASFERFIFEDETLKGETYYQFNSKGFSPKDAEQPFLVAMSFLLNEFAKGTDRQLSALFAHSDMVEIANFIHDRMHLDDPNFEIFAGRELIEENAVAESGNKPRIMSGEISQEASKSTATPAPQAPRSLPSMTQIACIGGAVACAAMGILVSPFYFIGAAACAILAFLLSNK